ncbi:3',5'-cyclic-nucleotide phosphodiesterase [Piscinibacter sakaiensis]|uniref:3',5'-cyclic-nucleotide phosphodiesterase n=1 Tax=Piscinibacter sakaiensis TaxID=1547922 RepID=A0A0K8NVB6_PISS1|nr:3',5'-cyclic-nucleotide phosphodiesterase [Piscinibacter sakaiensis]GAP34337.1 3',5'-cyclic-nucleotide phosphodiesterase [Piscinibacter sakaiensis]
MPRLPFAGVPTPTPPTSPPTSPRRDPGLRRAAGLPALLAACLLLARPALAEEVAASPGPAPAFDVVVLGATGGIQDGNLSAFLVRPAGAARGVACDAGSLVNGIRVAEARGAFDDLALPADGRWTRVGHVLRDVIQGVLLSHAHLDHVLGLVIASPDDAPKPVYALPSTHAALSASVFNWSAWPNLSDRGRPPRLGTYRLQDLAPGVRQPLVGTALGVTAYPLAHAGTESTAFLIDHGEQALLCLGDTGPDPVERSDRLQSLWQAVAPWLRQGRLRAIIVEASYPSDRPDALLFGHLTPAWLMSSLRQLAGLVGPEALRGLPLVVSHVKFGLEAGPSPAQRIERELEAANDLGLRIVMPRQGDRYRF